MIRCICVFIACIFCISCTDKEKNELILSAERMVNQYPDSVYHLLKDIKICDLYSDKEKADFALVYTEALYKSMRDVTSDSIIRIAWDYYGNGDDHLKAAKTNYYMGQVTGYNDSIQKATKYLIEAERYALEIGNNKLLGLIYCELGDNHLKQFTFKSAMDRYRKARAYFRLAADTANENYAIGNLAECFSLAEQNDSALYYYSDAKERAKIRKDQIYIEYLDKNLVPLYFKLKQWGQAKRIISDIYSPDSNKLVYYITFSLYYEGVNQMDSALYCVKKLLDDTLLSLTESQKIAVNYKASKCYENIGDYKQAYKYYIQSQDLQDEWDYHVKQDYIVEVEEKYRNEQLVSQNYLLRINSYNKTIILIVLIFITVLVGFIAILIYLHRKKIEREKQKQIDEYIGLIESIKDENEISKNNLLKKLNANTEKEQHLKSALEKRLSIIKQLTDLSFCYGDTHITNNVFAKKIKELMNVNILTQDTLDDLLEIVNMNYFGIVDFLKSHYDLSKEELELCCFICSGFTPQEMSVLYNVTVNSMYLRCSRLGKKMGLQTPLTMELKTMLENLKADRR